MMRLLAGDAHIAFEGDFSRTDFPATLPRRTDEDAILRRQTATPRLDMVILRLEKGTIRPILDVVLPDNRYMEDIIHIQIEKAGVLQFGCYDQFHDECVVCFSGVPAEFLDELQQEGILISWTTPHEGATRWHG